MNFYLTALQADLNRSISILIMLLCSLVCTLADVCSLNLVLIKVNFCSCDIYLATNYKIISLTCFWKIFLEKFLPRQRGLRFYSTSKLNRFFLRIKRKLLTKTNASLQARKTLPNCNIIKPRSHISDFLIIFLG